MGTEAGDRLEQLRSQAQGVSAETEWSPTEAGGGSALPRPMQGVPGPPVHQAAQRVWHCRLAGLLLGQGCSLCSQFGLRVPPSTPSSSGQGEGAGWEPPPVLDPLSIRSSERGPPLQVGASWPVFLIFSHWSSPPPPETTPQAVPSSFLEGSAGFPFFSAREGQPTWG